MYVFMSVNIVSRMCSMIACVRLKLDGGGGNSMIRYVTQGEAKLKLYMKRRSQK